MTKNTPLFYEVRTFFSVLLSGFAAVLLLLYHYHGELLTRLQHSLAPNQALVFMTILTLAYFVGQAIYQLGSLLDTLLYHGLQRSVFRDSRLSSMVKLIRKYQSFDSDVTSHIEWAYTRLCHDNPQLAHDIEKKRADSKMLLSFAVLALIALLFSSAHFIWQGIVFSLLALSVSLATNFLLRRQATDLTYNEILSSDEACNLVGPPDSYSHPKTSETTLSTELRTLPDHYQKSLNSLARVLEGTVTFAQIPAQQQRQITLPSDKRHTQLLCLQGGGYLSSAPKTVNKHTAQTELVFFSQNALIDINDKLSIHLTNTITAPMDVVIFRH